MQDKVQVSLNGKNIVLMLVLSHRHISKIQKDASVTLNKTSRTKSRSA